RGRSRGSSGAMRAKATLAGRRWRMPARRRIAFAGFPNRSHLICFLMHLQFICGTRAPMCARSNCCWAIATWLPRPAIYALLPPKCGVIQEIADDAGRLAAIAEKQIEAVTRQRSSLIIAPTHGECRAIA